MPSFKGDLRGAFSVLSAFLFLLVVDDPASLAILNDDPDGCEERGRNALRLRPVFAGSGCDGGGGEGAWTNCAGASSERASFSTTAEFSSS